MDPVWHARELVGISTSNDSQFVNLTPIHHQKYYFPNMLFSFK